ncbi:HNH endonuclease [Kineococcus glutinatus]|uniref:HNH endonuclease n=1 Tax=Kineococcus glutinatus TaxID=1070872 RepID=UPI0031E867B0
MPVLDPLDVGARVAELLATGRRVSTYKLATLDALLQHCLEHPAAPDAALTVPLEDLADRVIDLYWPQVRPFSAAGVLRQNEQPGRSIPDRVLELRTAAEVQGLRAPAQLRLAEPARVARARRDIAKVLAQQPLTALHTPGSGRAAPTEAFLYDDSWLHKKLTTADLDAHSWRIELRPGVAHALARVAGLLQPVLQRWWIDDIARLNAAAVDAPDLHGFLFGAARAAVATLAPGLTDLQAGRCFYCRGRLGEDVHVDHVLPWSRVAIDGLANLVAVDARCNLAKSATLPAVDHVEAVLARPVAALEDVGRVQRWPVERPRVVGAAVGLYRGSPTGTPLWRAPGVHDLLDHRQLARLADHHA